MVLETFYYLEFGDTRDCGLVMGLSVVVKRGKDSLKGIDCRPLIGQSVVIEGESGTV